MKKNYKKPEVQLFYFDSTCSLLADSLDPVESTRRSSGDPVTNNDGKTISGSIKETDGNMDPFGNHGQNGNTTRAKGSMWDDFDEEW